jgi:hypothetical protein
LDIGRALRTQAEACGELGSPMYAELLGALADDAEAGGPTARVLHGHEDDPGPSGLALRLVGSVHRLVLSGAAAELAAYYPSVGGAWSPAGVEAVLAFLDDRGDEVRPLLERAPQTNEVGRAAALLGGLLQLGERWPLPVRLFEIGSSGGLNLNADRVRYTDDAGGSWGPPDAALVLEGAWSGRRLPLDRRVRIVERGGSDVSPVDVATEDGRLTLASYVWPDMTARHARLAGAIDLARQSPVHVEESDAASYVELLALEPGAVTVLWHSVMWQYMPAGQQARVLECLADLGASASDDAPLVHLFAEPTRRTPAEDHRFWVVGESWPGGGEREFLGRMFPMGVPVTWE